VTAGLVERDLRWNLRARERADSTAQEHLSLAGKISTEAERLHQVKMGSKVCSLTAAWNQSSEAAFTLQLLMRFLWLFRLEFKCDRHRTFVARFCESDAYFLCALNEPES